MIIVNLKGGLGNQMFQYASARGIQKQNEKLILDLTFLLNNSLSSDAFTARSYELSIFKHLRASFADNFLRKVLYSQTLYFKVLRKFFFLRVKRITQKENEFVPTLLSIKGHICLDGYFQSEKYFSSIRKDLLQEFKFPELDKKNQSELFKIQSYPNSVSIHIRRGDYLKPEVLKKHGILPLSFYFNAIQALEDSISDPHYFIFSDDIEWCKENMKFIEGRNTFISNQHSSSAWKDMFLMTQCRHHIIANSSFSWWGAWLSQNENGLKYAPFRWFNSEVTKFDIHDFIPSAWQIVHYD